MFSVGADFLIQIILYLPHMVCLGALFHFHVFLAHSEQYCVVNPNYSEGGCKLGLRVFFSRFVHALSVSLWCDSLPRRVTRRNRLLCMPMVVVSRLYVSR